MRQALIWALCLALLWAGPGHALSCMRADVAQSFLRADADDARWGAVVGRLDFDALRLPQTDWDRQQDTPPVTELPAQLIGYSLTQDGWTDIFQQNVTLRVHCFGPWCAAPQTAQTYLAFVKRENGRNVVIASPCGGWLFPQPSAEDRARLHTCFRGGPCAPRPRP